MPVLLTLTVITIVSLIISVILCFLFFGRKYTAVHRSLKLSHQMLLTVFLTLTVSGLIAVIFCGVHMSDNTPTPPEDTSATTTAPSSSATTQPTQPTQPTQTEPTVPPTTEPVETFPTLQNVGKTEDSDPQNWDVVWDILSGEQILSDYRRPESITFADPTREPYFALPGISTFRGDNYRTGAAYGTVNLTAQQLSKVWGRDISYLKKGTGSGNWTGSGWTGQPLIVQWDDQTKQIMNLYPEKKAKEDLVEVIYATLDGHIYFYDLDDGTYTREPMNVGMAFKGAGSLDPRGYPILYVGAGDKTAKGKQPRMFVISLIDCTVMYEYGNADEQRHRNWIAFDSAPLVDAETDTLIWPGESGVLYTIQLNTAYDPESGTLSVDPGNIIRTRYTTSLDRTLGYEASSIIVENYIYIADNGGMLFCVDLNTMDLVWAQNTKDDNNATPAFEWGDDGIGYLYCATSMQYSSGSVYMYKINAATGEIIWETEFDNVYYDYSVSGGVLSSPVLGKKGSALEGMIIYSIAKTPGAYNGLLVALDTDTGEIIWESSLNNYCWSSPVAVYSDAGEAYLVLCDSAGNVMLLDPLTGQGISSINVGSNIEASPAIFNDMLVIGTRGQQVFGIRLS